MTNSPDGRLEETDLFVSWTGGCNTYRIPALICTPAGTLLAFCEGRRDKDAGDNGQVDMMLRRSTDGGVTWGPVQCIVTNPRTTTSNPCAVVDRNTGTVWLAFCTSPIEVDGLFITWHEVARGLASRETWIACSTDDGVTWAEPRKISGDVKRENWTCCDTGPGRGIQLADGRLMIPCYHKVADKLTPDDPFYPHVIVSDDAGRNWRIGGTLDAIGNESCLAETADGVYVNSRSSPSVESEDEPYPRVCGRSGDRGETFTVSGCCEDLADPPGGCQGSILRLDGAGPRGRDLFLYSGPTDKADRQRLAIRISEDDCHTWREAKALCEGQAAYSDLAQLPDGTILCLYESGEDIWWERIRLARFSLEWLRGGP